MPSAYLLLSNVLVENQRQLAREGSKETCQPQLVWIQRHLDQPRNAWWPHIAQETAIHSPSHSYLKGCFYTDHCIRKSLWLIMCNNWIFWYIMWVYGELRNFGGLCHWPRIRAQVARPSFHRWVWSGDETNPSPIHYNCSKPVCYTTAEFFLGLISAVDSCMHKYHRNNYNMIIHPHKILTIHVLLLWKWNNFRV